MISRLSFDSISPASLGWSFPTGCVRSCNILPTWPHPQHSSGAFRLDLLGLQDCWDFIKLTKFDSNLWVSSPRLPLLSLLEATAATCLGFWGTGLLIDCAIVSYSVANVMALSTHPGWTRLTWRCILASLSPRKNLSMTKSSRASWSSLGKALMASLPRLYPNSKKVSSAFLTLRLNSALYASSCPSGLNLWVKAVTSAS